MQILTESTPRRVGLCYPKLYRIDSLLSRPPFADTAEQLPTKKVVPPIGDQTMVDTQNMDQARQAESTMEELLDRSQSEMRVGAARASLLARSANADLVGGEDSRWGLSTPALILDLDAFERNIQTMAGIAEKAGLALRPHVKTHKCSSIAKRQISAGAIGVCCATLDEAATMIAAEVPGVHVTSPATGSRKVQQLIALAERAPSIMIVIDHLENARDIAAAANAAGLTVNVLVDIDPGMNRTGIASDAEFFALVHLAAETAGLNYRGIQCYDGNLQHIEAPDERRAAVEQIGERISRLTAELMKAGLKPAIVSGGGTGSAQMESAEVFTELQVGSYIVMDVEYARVRTSDSHTLPFVPALFVSSTVINSHRDGQSTIDAGTKAIARGWSPPTMVRPADTGITYQFSGDEHGRLIYPDNRNNQLPAGSRVELFVPHCDPNIDLFAFYHCVRSNRLVDIWPIDARSNR